MLSNKKRKLPTDLEIEQVKNTKIRRVNNATVRAAYRKAKSYLKRILKK